MTHRSWFIRPFVVVVVLSFGSHQIAAQTLDSAIDFYDSGEFVAALDGFIVLATNGKVAAQYYLGRMYHHGDGVLRDVGMAARWYKLAAEGGHYLARLQLGHMFKTGEGVPKDGNEAAKWYGLAAEQGQAKAEEWINFAIDLGAGEAGPLPELEPNLTRSTLAERGKEFSRIEANLQEPQGREEELAQALASERSELERLALLLQRSREAQERTGEALKVREMELHDAGERIDQLIASLSSVRDHTRELEAELSTEEERTLLAQQEVADSNQQITELTRRLGIVEGERDLAVELGDSQAQQIADLRDRLASLNSALEAAEIKAAQDLAQITSPNARVQELTRQLGVVKGERDMAIELIGSQAQQIAGLRDRLTLLNSTLEAAGIRAAQDLVQITSLSERLDAALAAQDLVPITSPDSRVQELTRRLGIVEGERDLAVELGDSQAQQIADLRDRLASLNSALEAAEIKAAQDLVQITSLGERLNAALAVRVQELVQVTPPEVRVQELTRRLGIVEGERDLAVELGDSQAQQIADLRDRLSSLNSALEAAEVKAAQDLVQITSLGERLNAALAARVQDLSRYQSDFLARLHDHLGNREGVKVEGDRFIIQSGVLFSSGSAEISGAGRENLRQIAGLIRELVSDIPDDVDWILRVDGHTDSKPIQTIRFPSNWELSTARATSVVRFLISLGVPEHRLMAAGLGEFQPLASGEDTDTMQRNRRIEFKLTDR